jgi:hypothetical protein
MQLAGARLADCLNKHRQSRHCKTGIFHPLASLSGGGASASASSIDTGLGEGSHVSDTAVATTATDTDTATTAATASSAGDVSSSSSKREHQNEEPSSNMLMPPVDYLAAVIRSQQVRCSNITVAHFSSKPANDLLIDFIGINTG